MVESPVPTPSADPPLPARAISPRAGPVLEEERPVIVDVGTLSFFYGDKIALENISIQLRSNLVTAFHRTLGLREEHLPAHAEPHERPRRRSSRRGAGHHRWS